MPPRFLSFISVFSQVQLREPSYTCVQYIKTETLATTFSKAQRNCEKDPFPFSGSNSSRLILVVQQELFAKDPVNLNVEGHEVLSPLQGFGQLWQKMYQARVKNATVAPGEIVRVWKENFPQFWPKGNRFYAPPTGITPGAVAILSFGMPRVPGSLGIQHLRYGLDDDRHRTLKEAGEELGVTRERIRQIELKALQELHEPSCVWKLKDYLW